MHLVSQPPVPDTAKSKTMHYETGTKATGKAFLLSLKKADAPQNQIQTTTLQYSLYEERI